MRVDKLRIDNFKNLKNFEVDIDESQLTSVFIGRNGSGKSNLFEALVIIFRDLDLDLITADFSYRLNYNCSNFVITVNSSKESKKREFIVNGNTVKKTTFYANRDKYLPAHIFAYYSGPSKRLEQYFSKHQNKFYKALLNNNDEVIRPLFYARLIHSNFVLLAFFSFFESKNTKFLRDYLDIESIESVLFVLKKASWVKETRFKKYSKQEFWGAKGVVRGFLDDLYQHALAPLSEEAEFEDGFKTIKTEVTYLYLKGQKELEKFAEKYKVNTDFFKYLESTYLSDLIEEVRIKIKKTDGSIITFKELSEGEQQLLTVLGLLKFTKAKEALFLLDEPDTHLNPAWKFNYLNLIKEIVGETDNSQVIISTHDPIVIGGLPKEAVTIFERLKNKITVKTPDVDPKGMGVAGLLTSELFGLSTTLDAETQQKLDRKRKLFYSKDKSIEDNKELHKLEKELENLGFTRTTRDPLYDKFIERLYSRSEYQSKEITNEDRKKMTCLIDEILDEILKEENK